MIFLVFSNSCFMYWIQLQTTGSGPKKESRQRKKAPKKCVSLIVLIVIMIFFFFLMNEIFYTNQTKNIITPADKTCWNPKCTQRTSQTKIFYFRMWFVLFIILFTFFDFVWFRPKVSSALFFNYNTSLGPPYRVLIDTNFINFSIQNKVSDL